MALTTSQMATKVAVFIQDEIRREKDSISQRLAALADAIERREEDAPDLCRLSDHMQDLCACRELASLLRNIAGGASGARGGAAD